MARGMWVRTAGRAEAEDVQDRAEPDEEGEPCPGVGVVGAILV